MGAFQSAFSKVVAGAMAGKLLEKKRKNAIQNVEDIKIAKLNQKKIRAKYRADIEAYNAKYEKSKYAKIQAKQKTAELKATKERITLGGEAITDPELVKKIKKEAK